MKSIDFNNYILSLIKEDDIDTIKENTKVKSKLGVNGEVKHKDLILYSSFQPKLCITCFINTLLDSNIVDKNDKEICKIYFIALLNRLCNTTYFKLTQLNCHRTVLILLMLTSKFIDDESLCNNTWALSVGLKLSEINNMEVILLELLDYNIFISSEQLLHVNKSIDFNKKGNDSMVSINID
mgnify:FL=1